MTIMTVQDLINKLSEFPADAVINVASDHHPDEDYLLSTHDFRCFMDCSKNQINISI